MNEMEKLRETVDFLGERFGTAPKVGLVLGSGLGEALAGDGQSERVSYGEIPHFPQSAVVGHAGELTVDASRTYCALSGRVHLYEGHPPQRIVFAVRALALWGVQRFIVTNAAGAINQDFRPGELMLLTDHINLQGANPLEGDNLAPLGERFPDMSHAYSEEMRRLAIRCAQEMGLALRQGVYVAVRGPSYETPAEIRMCRTLGADAVGMSTVPEAIALNHMRRQVLGISCLTNMAAGILEQPLVHDEVLEVTRKARDDFARLLAALIRELNEERP